MQKNNISTKDFIKSLSSEGNVEYTLLNNKIVRTIDENLAFANTTDNIYFLCDVKDGVIGRAKDSDILSKRYFAIDLDIRKEFKNIYLQDCDDEYIIQEGLHLAKFLGKENEYFGEWKYIVFSGGGLHIYYVGKPSNLTPDMYSKAVNRIFRKWNDLMGGGVYDADLACKNKARIFRLPGGINQKYGNKVKIIAYQDVESRLVNLLPGFAEKELQEEKELEEKRLLEINKLLSRIDNNDDRNLYLKIVTEIPAWQLSMKLLPQFKYNGKKNFYNGKGGYTGFFYNNRTNTICNGGSRHYNWGSPNSCYNNFSLVRHFFNLTNRETFDFFKKLIK